MRGLSLTRRNVIIPEDVFVSRIARVSKRNVRGYSSVLQQRLCQMHGGRGRPTRKYLTELCISPSGNRAPHFRQPTCDVKCLAEY
jgi:hypothetical protein